MNGMIFSPSTVSILKLSHFSLFLCWVEAVGGAGDTSSGAPFMAKKQRSSELCTWAFKSLLWWVLPSPPHAALWGGGWAFQADWAGTPGPGQET